MPSRRLRTIASSCGATSTREAVNQIGLALQVLDDLTDFGEDVAHRNHNMLRSWIVCRGPDGPATDASLTDMSRDNLARPESVFPKATREVLALAVELALPGFGLLHKLGHAVDRAASVGLISTMFHLRGLSHLWKLYDGKTEVPTNLIEQRTKA